MNMTCAVCGHRDGNTTHVAREMMFGTRDTFTYVECLACGCLTLADPPGDMGLYYPPEYYSYTRPDVRRPALKQQLLDCRTRYTLFGSGLLGQILFSLKHPPAELCSLQSIPLSPDSRVMDVGCGAGVLLHELWEIGMRNLLGIDPFNEQDLISPGGLQILRRDLSEVDGEWDLLMFHHSFEHVADPLDTLNHVARLLAPGGTALIRMPTVSSFAWEHYGVDWVQLDAPRHYVLHSHKSIEVLAESASLTLKSVQSDSDSFQFWGSEQYRRDIPLMDPCSHAVNPDASIFSPSEIKDYERQSHTLNRTGRGDQAVFILQAGTVDT